MSGVKGKSGGKRSGAGRSTLKEKSIRKSLLLSDQANTLLEQYSKELGVSRSDLVDALCIMYLNKDNKSILISYINSLDKRKTADGGGPAVK